MAKRKPASPSEPQMMPDTPTLSLADMLRAELLATKDTVITRPVRFPPEVDAGRFEGVHVKVLNGGTRTRFDKQTQTDGGALWPHRAFMVMIAACTEAGTLIFKESDFDVIKGIDNRIVDAIANEAFLLNLITRESVFVDPEAKN